MRSPADSSRSDLSIYNERSSTLVEGLATVKSSIGLTRTRRPSVFRQTGRLAKKRLKFIKMFRSCRHMSTFIDSYGFLRKFIFFVLLFFLRRNSDPVLISSFNRFIILRSIPSIPLFFVSFLFLFFKFKLQMI